MSVAMRQARSAAPQRFNLRDLSILVVDDSPTSTEVFLQVLTGLGIARCASCDTVVAARDLLAREPYDLVIADGEMPGEDGFDLTEGLRANGDSPNFSVAVIIASTYTPTWKIERARDIGAHMVICKPPDPTILMDRIEFLAKSPREFIVSATYCGPDRRFKVGGPPPGVEERRETAKRLLADPERALSQDDINSLFD